MRFEELIPPDDRIILVDSGAVQFQDDEGTKGINILTDIECTHDRVCMYIYIYIYIYREREREREREYTVRRYTYTNMRHRMQTHTGIRIRYQVFVTRLHVIY